MALSLLDEECGRITKNGEASLSKTFCFATTALEYNKSFLLDAALKFPMLRLVSLDKCDAKEGDFDLPEEIAT